VYSREPEYFFWSYLLYSSALTQETADEVALSQQKFRPMGPDSVYTLGNITFSARCAPPELPGSGGVAIVQIDHSRCDSEVSEVMAKAPPTAVETPAPAHLSILAVLDSGQRFHIYGDTTCQSTTSGFVHLQSLKQLAVESQAPAEFCENWIKNLSLIQPV
jgi:hypothetical protein